MKKMNYMLLLPLSVLTVLTASFPFRTFAAGPAEEVQLSPDLSLSIVSFTPYNAEYAYTGQEIKPVFQVRLENIVPSSVYTTEIISSDDAEKGTSAGIRPGTVIIKISTDEDADSAYYGSTTAVYKIIRAKGLKATAPQTISVDGSGSFDLNTIQINKADAGARSYAPGGCSDPDRILSDLSLDGSVLHFTASGTAGTAVQTVKISTENYQDTEVQLTFRAEGSGQGERTAADAAALQNWLLTKPDAAAPDMQKADMNKDGVLNGSDLSLMKQELLKKKETAMNNPPANMPKILDETGTVTPDDCQALWTAAANRYPNTDLSDFTFRYDPDHPLQNQTGGMCFTILYKGIAVHTYGGPNTSSSAYANIFKTAAGRRQTAVSLVIDPKDYAEINTDVTWIDAETITAENPALYDPERIIFLDPWHDAIPKPAYRAFNASQTEETILDAETGETITVVSLAVT